MFAEAFQILAGHGKALVGRAVQPKESLVLIAAQTATLGIESSQVILRARKALGSGLLDPDGSLAVILLEPLALQEHESNHVLGVRVSGACGRDQTSRGLRRRQSPQMTSLVLPSVPD